MIDGEKPLRRRQHRLRIICMAIETTHVATVCHTAYILFTAHHTDTVHVIQ